ncbi:homocysteine S-methyltransferase family protein [candidate division KSB1 bacterium]|nr:homocysteine S-methyltransferase family protein [candidate division KSB1 bacterium]
MNKSIPQPFLPNRTILLDGGVGRELRFRGVEVPKTIWSANALLVAPEVVRQIHIDYIFAGADIITTNTYGVKRADLAEIGIESLFEELIQLACKLARQARTSTGQQVLIAGSLAPLRGSFRPDLVGDPDKITPVYQEQAELMAPYVDLFLCETISSATEARASAEAACSTGKPVWVSWTLHEDRSGNLRSGETILEAAETLQDLPVCGFLVNCSSPESITSAIPHLASLDTRWCGGYANIFKPIAQDWKLNGDKETDGFIPLRYDLNPMQYSEHVMKWLDSGATVVGGCCGTRPAHIKLLKEIIDQETE